MRRSMLPRGAKQGVLVPPGGGETIRAFAVFAGSLAILVWVAHAVAVKDMSRIAGQYRYLRGLQEAQRVAEAVTALGRGPTGMDFHRIRQKRAILETLLAERLAARPDLSWVEVRDRFDVPVTAVRSPHAAQSGGTINTSAPLMVGGIPQGEVRVGVSTEAIDADIETLRRALRIKVGIVVAVGVALLVLGLFYVLHLIRKNRALEQARLSAERAAYRGLLGSGLAHEIRNPLNSMNMNLQMLEEELHGVPGLETGEHVEMLRSVQSEIKRIKDLIDNFLQYARPATPQFEVKDLNRVIDDTARFLQADFRRSGIDLELDLEPLLPSVEVDESQLRQVLLNVLGNARQVMSPGGRARVTSRAGTAGEVVIEIADTGPGIPAESLEHIFDPFFSRRAGGTGLGLAIARQMVENHGGRIEVESRVGEGTTFRVKLPRRRARATDGPSPKGMR